MRRTFGGAAGALRHGLPLGVTAADRPPLQRRAPRFGRVTDAGRSPGSRVLAVAPPSRTVRPVAFGAGLAAYSCGGSRGVGSKAAPRSQRSVPESPGADHLHRNEFQRVRARTSIKKGGRAASTKPTLIWGH